MLEAIVIVVVLLGSGMTLHLWRQSQRLRAERAEQAGQELLQATEAGDLTAMHALLRQGAAINARNAQGWTALHVAAAGGDVEVVALLLQHGADVHAQSYIGITALDNALVRGGRKAVLDLLRAHGAQSSAGWDGGL